MKHKSVLPVGFVPSIEKNIEIPSWPTASGKPSIWETPVKAMEVDDSMFMPGFNTGRAMTTIKHVTQRLGLERKYVSRTVQEAGVPGARIWRVE